MLFHNELSNKSNRIEITDFEIFFANEENKRNVLFILMRQDYEVSNGFLADTLFECDFVQINFLNGFIVAKDNTEFRANSLNLLDILLELNVIALITSFAAMFEYSQIVFRI